MTIGYQVKKYQAAKTAQAAADQAAAEQAEAPAVEAARDVADEDRVPNIPAPPSSRDLPVASPAATVSQADFLAAISLLIQEMRGTDNSESKERLVLETERLLLEQERVKREMPENKQSPGISVYSYPEGELAHPKEPLKCKMFWVGYEMKTDTLTPIEVQLLNRLTPGDYRVTKADGVQVPFKVAAKYSDRVDPITSQFVLDELAVWFPSKDEHRQNHGSMVSYLQQALGERIPSVQELMVELERLKAELAAARTGVLSAV